MSVVSLLPVPQIRESHALHVDPHVLVDPVVTIAAPPYSGMAVGDKVTYHFVTLDEGAWPVELAFTVGDADVGRVITWALDAGELWMVFSSQARTWYEVTRAGTQTRLSAEQMFTVDALPDGRLPAPAIANHDGDGLDPSLFPDGVTVTLPIYPGAAVGDTVLVYWRSARTADSTVLWHALSAADIGRGEVQVPVEPRWLEANVGSQVSVTYQYAREGVAESSNALAVDILLPVVLEPPVVEDAQAEGGGDNGARKGFLMAADVRRGSYINVPASDHLTDARTLALHWDGHANGGQHVADAPHEVGKPLRFFVPASAIAANIGAEAKRFKVFYRATLANGREYSSRNFLLWIKPLSPNEYIAPQCRQSAGNEGLALSDVPPEGAEIYLTTWPFIAAGQKLTIWIEGTTAAGVPTDYIARNAVPVAQSEVDAKVLSGRVPASFLTTLRVNGIFGLIAKVSYDGGETAVRFGTGTVRWLG